jgi:type IV pilus secretin PilQ/predicted competence protein
MKRSRQSTWIALWAAMLATVLPPVWCQATAQAASLPVVNAGYLENVTFEKLPGKERVILKVSKQTGVSVENQSGNAVLVRLENLFAPAGLQRPLAAPGLANVLQVTPVQKTAEGRSWVLATIDLKQKVPYSVKQTGMDVLIDFNVASLPAGGDAKPSPAAGVSGPSPAAGTPARPPAPGRAASSPPLFLDVQDADIRAVFRLLAEYGKVSIVAGDDVKGAVTLHLKDVSWEQALQTLLKIKGLAKIEQDNVIVVMTQENFLKRRAAEEAAAKQAMKKADTEELVTRVVPIKYRLLKDVANKKIDMKRDVIAAGVAVPVGQGADAGPAGTDKGAAEAYPGRTIVGTGSRMVKMEGAGDFFAFLQSLLSVDSEGRQRGWIGADADTNSVIITATRADMVKIMDMIARIDIPTEQILIKAHIVETTKSMARDLGIKWGGTYRAALGNHDVSATPSLPFQAAPIQGLPALLDLTFGTIGGNILELQLSALQRDGKLNILSSPSILTMDNQVAFTENGEEIPIRTLDKDGNPTTVYTPATLRLEITPHVIDGENMKMDIHVKKDEVDLTRSVLGNPFKIKKETKTNLLVKDGETIVISGLTKRTEDVTTTGLPWLKDVPGLGWLFKGEQKGDTMEEVLIFITPVIIKDKTVAGIQTGQ